MGAFQEGDALHDQLAVIVPRIQHVLKVVQKQLCLGGVVALQCEAVNQSLLILHPLPSFD